MADGSIQWFSTNTLASESELFDLACPMRTAEGTMTVDILDELSDVLNLARVLVGQHSQELADDSTVRGSLGSMLYRAHLRAKTASEVAYQAHRRRKQAAEQAEQVEQAEQPENLSNG